MGKKYNTHLIKADYSYYVEQVAELFDIDIATVRRWIRDEGLKRAPNNRPHTIHSSELKTFLDKQQAKRKKPGAGNEVFCFRCQWPRTPQANSATILPLPNSRIRFMAICSTCCCKMNRNIRGAEWGQNHPLAIYLSDATGEHSGVQPTHRECPLQQEEKPCLNITH